MKASATARLEPKYAVVIPMNFEQYSEANVDNSNDDLHSENKRNEIRLRYGGSVRLPQYTGDLSVNLATLMR